MENLNKDQEEESTNRALRIRSKPAFASFNSSLNHPPMSLSLTKQQSEASSGDRSGSLNPSLEMVLIGSLLAHEEDDGV